jgi:hypothetical protein
MVVESDLMRAACSAMLESPMARVLDATAGMRGGSCVCEESMEPDTKVLWRGWLSRVGSGGGAPKLRRA